MRVITEDALNDSKMKTKIKKHKVKVISIESDYELKTKKLHEDHSHKIQRQLSRKNPYHNLND